MGEGMLAEALSLSRRCVSYSRHLGHLGTYVAGHDRGVIITTGILGTYVPPA